MGVNADGRRELLGLQVGDSESEGFPVKPLVVGICRQGRKRKLGWSAVWEEQLHGDPQWGCRQPGPVVMPIHAVPPL